jgi:hypothetical protein
MYPIDVSPTTAVQLTNPLRIFFRKKKNTTFKQQDFEG